MKKIFLFVLLTCLIARALAQAYKPEYGKPLVVLTQVDPWVMVIGSDAPTFALYQNGQILYKKTIANKIKYFQTSVPIDKIPETLRKLNVTDSLKKLPSNIVGTTASDQPTNLLMLDLSFRKGIQVYGSLFNTKRIGRQKTPKAFLNAFDKLTNFQDPKAKEWLPDNIEVMLTSYSYSPQTPMNWPTEWPNLKDKHTVRRNVDQYSIYIDRKELDKLKKIVSLLGEKQAIKVSGR
ncbi:hypothetical protein [Mucilaginibacter kameinonensis]|uniref:hypothetical protein n=1 Tax=Mucilaginibacter kameinonensis TaxID=452286 RepID=UPI000EF7CC5A|nr:hypothetical protein [Mucilaginibacter kameinonensis]